MNILIKASIFLALITFSWIDTPLLAQAWQWSADVPGDNHRKEPSSAYLWIPPESKQVRGVVFAQNNMEELSILKHPTFRKEMAALEFAEIWVSPSFSHVFNFKQGAGEIFNGMMGKLADVSGYEELAHAPIVYIGHSAAASAPYNFAVWAPERTLACLSISGQWPYFRHETFAPDIWEDRNIDFIPCLETMGEYEAANTWSNEGLKERQDHPLLPLSMLACPAEGHFASTDKKIDYLIFYIKKAIQYRLPEKYPESGPPQLNPIDPTTTGWLAEKWVQDKEPSEVPASVGTYAGDPAQAFWFFDEEHVRETEKYQVAFRNKKAPLLGYVQEGKLVPQRDTHQQVDLKFIPEGDGMTFHLEGTFLDTVPGESPRPAAWTALPAGSPVGNAGTKELISVNKIIGPFEKINDHTFVVRLGREADVKQGNYELWFAVTHPGSDTYKPAVQQARMVIPAINELGEPQEIVFPEIKNQKYGKRSVKLKARATSGLPVQYYVKSGPAEVKGNVLHFTKVPVHTKFPVKITVVAYQYGTTTTQACQSASEIERVFFLNR